MTEFSEYFQKLFQLDSVQGILMLLVLLPLLGLVIYRLNTRKEIDNNGKVVLSRKWNLTLKQFLPVESKVSKKQITKRKPFTNLQKRLLRLLYSAHEALFGLIIFVFGLGLISKVFIDLADGSQRAFDSVLLTCTLLGLVALPVGVLLIYFRDADNPFDDS